MNKLNSHHSKAKLILIAMLPVVCALYFSQIETSTNYNNTSSNTSNNTINLESEAQLALSSMSSKITSLLNEMMQAQGLIKNLKRSNGATVSKEWSAPWQKFDRNDIVQSSFLQNVEPDSNGSSFSGKLQSTLNINPVR